MYNFITIPSEMCINIHLINLIKCRFATSIMQTVMEGICKQYIHVEAPGHTPLLMCSAHE